LICWFIKLRKSPLKLLSFFILTALIIFIIGRYASFGRFSIVPRFVIDSSAFIFGRFEYLNRFAGELKRFRSLADENNNLKKNNFNLLSRLAMLDILEQENDFLKNVLKIKKEISPDIIYANIFNVNLGHDGYNVLLNKGSKEGVKKGDIVITEQKALLGIVEDVSDNFSRVLFVFDPKFKTTAKVLGSDVVGIAKGAYQDKMRLELISKEDKIKEGDILITTGDDMFPPALLVGFISYVDSNESGIFKNIRINPAIEEQFLGRVIVLSL